MSRRDFPIAEMSILSGVAVVALLTGIATATVSMKFVLGSVALFALLAIWLIRERRVDRLPLVYYGFFILLIFSSLLPTSVNLPLQLGALGGAICAWLLQPKAVRRGGPVVGWAVAITCFWFLLMFNDNIPSVSVGILGFRKSVLALGGLILGCSIAAAQVRSAEALVIRTLTAGLAISIIGRLWIPALDDIGADKSADSYTALFDGARRLQGIFAGPFHVAVCGVFLLGWCLVRFRRHKIEASLVGLVSIVATYLTLVRTAYVAIVVVVLVYMLISPRFEKFLMRAAGTLVATLLLAYIVLTEDSGLASVANSLGQISSDGRFLNRFPEYILSWNLFLASPLWGWGAGSAGDVMGQFFGPDRVHVTAHNLVFKIMVEGGMIGLLLWAGLFTVLILSIIVRSDSGALALISLAGLTPFALTGSAIEALPVSYVVFFAVGLAVTRQRSKERVIVHSADKSMSQVHSRRATVRRSALNDGTTNGFGKGSTSELRIDGHE
ncbi:O-antigen ligase family protein [Rhodococcoides fascians]|uniref:O-antigen ligase family protein n=1 Tax=Rhodococcoides fascians TaxID=1828 RepID=UPI00050C2BBA|nr:O-antigen ligase family protein [Rhodococcus fascians]